jgi:hypothetical protein
MADRFLRYIGSFGARSTAFENASIASFTFPSFTNCTARVV